MASPQNERQQNKRLDTAKQDLRLFGNVRVLCAAAMLAALSFVLAYLAKLLQGANPIRFTVECMPIILGGMTFGPLIGAAIGCCADLLSCLAAGQSVNPLITLCVVYIGLAAGIAGRYVVRKPGLCRILLTEIICHVPGSMMMKSLALRAWGYAWGVLVWRIPVYCGIIAAESALLFIILKQKSIRNEIEAIYRNDRTKK